VRRSPLVVRNQTRSSPHRRVRPTSSSCCWYRGWNGWITRNFPAEQSLCGAVCCIADALSFAVIRCCLTREASEGERLRSSRHLVNLTINDPSILAERQRRTSRSSPSAPAGARVGGFSDSVPSRPFPGSLSLFWCYGLLSTAIVSAPPNAVPVLNVRIPS
jgi:hypothetical protein